MDKKDLDNEKLTDEIIELTMKQEKFCQVYTSESEFFGNGVNSYIEVYQPDKTKKNRYEGAKASASRLLSNVNICARINQLLEDQGLNDENVDKQLLFLINQHSEKAVKLGAIREYNLLRARLEKNRQKLLDDGKITKDVIPAINISIEGKGQGQVLE